VAVHIYTQSIHRTTQITTEQHKYKLMWKSAGRAPSFASFTLAFALQLRKKHGKTSIRVRKTSVTVQYTYYQKHPHITKPSQTHTLQNPLIHTHAHTHTTKQYKTTTVQIKTKCIPTFRRQSVPKRRYVKL